MQDANKTSRQPGIMSLLKPYKKWVILLLLFTLLGSAINLLIPLLIARGIDAYETGVFDFRATLFPFAGAILAVFIFTWVQSILQTYASEKVARNLRATLSDKLSRQSYAFIEGANPSKLLTNLTADIDSIKLFVSQAIVAMLSSLCIIVGASILLLSINWKLALCVIAIIPIIGITFYVVLRKVKVLFTESRAVIDWLNKVINESILGAAIIRVVNSQQRESAKFLEANLRAKHFGLAILNLFAGLVPIITFTANMAILVILAMGGHFVIDGVMSLGDFAAFNSYLAMLIFPILVIGFMSNVMAQASASYGRISSILTATETPVEGSLATTLSGKIELKNIEKLYGQIPVLKNIQLQIRPGSKTAVIGPTAAGKTQLLYLLTGLIKPDKGSLLFDDKTIGHYDPEVFHSQIGFVFQDSILFQMSIRENIAFSDSVTDASLEKAIVTAELKELIDGLPNKLDTIVSERGTNLSGGQKQRIMLARALAVNPRLLLLDDFTARVDAATEKKILANIERNYPALTLISVTQKIATVEQYDKIVLLMQGEIMAEGSHDHLLRTSPEYVQLFRSQQSTSNYELQS